MTIEWKDSYKIGNAAIDAQHQVWFARINSFLGATDRKSLQSDNLTSTPLTSPMSRQKPQMNQCQSVRHEEF